MDGTGELFEDFLQFYSGAALTLSLPNQGNQSYVSIAKKVSNELPDSDFVLLVESFSGGLVEHLLDVPQLRGVIFVASFVSAPNKAMLFLAKCAPKKLLTFVPGSRVFAKLLFLGGESGRSEYFKFVKVVRSVSARCLNSRITAMIGLKRPTVSEIDLPCVYIMPNQDRLVSQRKYNEISTMFVNSRCYRLDGPHFILQAKPKKSAEVVKLAMHYITKRGSG